MPTTPFLAITEVASNQNQKEVTINDAIKALESATNARLVVSFAAGTTQTVSATNFTRNIIMEPTAATGPCTLQLPATVNSLPTHRMFVVFNNSGHALTVRSVTGGGDTVTMPNGAARLLYMTNGLDVIVAAEPETLVNFIELGDVPSTYAGQVGKVLVVNATEDALEFLDISDAAFPSKVGNAGKVLRVNVGETAVEWVDASTLFNFLTLPDTPNSYAGQEDKLVAVNPGATGLVFIDPPTADLVTYPSTQRWRIRIDIGSSETQSGFGEIIFRDVDNISLMGSGTASASSFEVGTEPGDAFDGSTAGGNGWLTADPAGVNEWIEYDFGVPVDPRSVVITAIDGFETFSPAQIVIERFEGVWINAGTRVPADWVTTPTQTFSINGAPFESITEAPEDGGTYARRNAAWEEISEKIRDVIGATLVQGSNITISVNDAGDTITIAGPAPGLDAEGVRDTIGATLVEGANIDITVNDAGDTITIAAPGQYRLGFSIETTVPAANEVLLRHVFTSAVTFADDFAGSVARLRPSGPNPLVAQTFPIYLNGSLVGNLTISTAGVRTFTTTGTTVVTAIGDELRIDAPGSVDANILGVSVTLLGVS